MPLEAGLLEILACPACHAPLREEPDAGGEGGSAGAEGAEGASGGELVCTGADCGLAYPIRDDIPVLLVDEARRPA
ncbi:Trm112 family protein [Streptomyces armeniacus]|uniref:Trm112 family protein n=1 Tax=Streptomyces armeniacus TaxID=83291 RepID=A0A345XQH4_9ACTN|nr:Trm112 family protein [Streptomyces armeniacus]AXK33890.1 Trm112 family protein [Streptomyces armeniacus]